MKLTLATCTVKAAKRWVKAHHSRLKNLTGALAAVAVEADRVLVCVAVVGQPKARKFQIGTIAEVTRVASDGTARHACSMAYGAARRLALAMAYRRIISYTHLDEPAYALKAAGFWPVALTRGGEWDRPSRSRQMMLDPRKKIRWEAGPDALPFNPKVALLVPGWRRASTAADVYEAALCRDESLLGRLVGAA